MRLKSTQQKKFLFVCEIFNEAVNNLRYVVSNMRMGTNNEFETVWNKIVVG